ncbi:hypothetical protein AB0C12_03205 [Actinoplanes sp. NPDC048967]|uniref:hypothetical protein n=1 Tax=Actinoplanes sp. NPDC048967 TaxID=3155269 RepID=UPI0033F04DDF
MPSAPGPAWATLAINSYAGCTRRPPANGFAAARSFGSILSGLPSPNTPRLLLPAVP